MTETLELAHLTLWRMPIFSTPRHKLKNERLFKTAHEVADLILEGDNPGQTIGNKKYLADEIARLAQSNHDSRNGAPEAVIRAIGQRFRDDPKFADELQDELIENKPRIKEFQKFTKKRTEELHIST